MKIGELPEKSAPQQLEFFLFLRIVSRGKIAMPTMNSRPTGLCSCRMKPSDNEKQGGFDEYDLEIRRLPLGDPQFGPREYKLMNEQSSCGTPVVPTCTDARPRLVGRLVQKECANARTCHFVASTLKS